MILFLLYSYGFLNLQNTRSIEIMYLYNNHGITKGEKDNLAK